MCRNTVLLQKCPCQNLFALSCAMYVAAIRYASCIAHLCLRLLPRFDTYNTNKCYAILPLELSCSLSNRLPQVQDSSNSSTTVQLKYVDLRTI